MPLLHLIDRPVDTSGALEQGRRFGAMASAASHGAAVLLLVAAAHVTRDAAVTTTSNTFNPLPLVWIPNRDTGGGHPSGGDNSPTPPRQVRAIGRDEMSIAATPDRTIESTVDSPAEPTIPARPMGDAMSAFAGAVIGERAGDSLGPNAGRGGDGNGPGNSPFDGPQAGGPGVTTPVVITQVKPQYTADAMRAKVQGVAVVECVVLPDGSVGEARIRRSLDPTFGLDQQALAAAKKWRFKPGLLNGTPMPVIVSIELTFTLR